LVLSRPCLGRESKGEQAAGNQLCPGPPFAPHRHARHLRLSHDSWHLPLLLDYFSAQL